MRWLIAAYLLALTTASLLWYRIGCDVGWRRGFNYAVGIDYNILLGEASDNDDRRR